ncbi:MAG: sigma-70 family RNA polymerase sigma factor [Candidatus Latescibacterota bacterium]|nr:MAG: sigma-70 family RNA polymerase sigma factor [Candidatus Latescibacterota bacterium]
MVKEEDRELIARARKGDEGAYRTLLGKYERAVFNICLKMVRDREEARDLAQDAFIKVFSMLDRYNPSFAFSNWLFKITSNLCIDSMRKRRVDTLPMDEPVRGAKGEYERQYASPTATPDKVLLKKEKMKLLSRAIEELPPHYRIMIVLRHQEGLSYEEIAETLEVPLGTVKARIHRAREMLKTRLDGEDFW